MCDRFAFFAAQSWLAPVASAVDGAIEREEIFRGACSFSRSVSEQYGEQRRASGSSMHPNVKDDRSGAMATDVDDADEGIELRGALASDASHVTFGITETWRDPASVDARFIATRARATSSDGTTGSTSAADKERVVLECELDGKRYRMSTRTCLGITTSLQERKFGDAHSPAKECPRYLSVIFPHVTLNVYSSAEDASWDGLQALERALRDPALATEAEETPTQTSASALSFLRPGDVPTSIGDDIEDEDDIATASAFSAQRFAADALVDAARALLTDPNAWSGVSERMLFHGVRDAFVDAPRSYDVRVCDDIDDDA